MHTAFWDRHQKSIRTTSQISLSITNIWNKYETNIRKHSPFLFTCQFHEQGVLVRPCSPDCTCVIQTVSATTWILKIQGYVDYRYRVICRLMDLRGGSSGMLALGILFPLPWAYVLSLSLRMKRKGAKTEKSILSRQSSFSYNHRMSKESVVLGEFPTPGNGCRDTIKARKISWDISILCHPASRDGEPHWFWCPSQQ